MGLTLALCFMYWLGAIVQAAAEDNAAELYIVHFGVGVVTVLTVIAAVLKGIAR